MRNITKTVYLFSELSEKAKEKARDWWRQGDHIAWGSESLDSIKAFCTEFGVNLRDYSVDPYSRPTYSTDADNSNFRGRKLKEFDRDAMPTGFCLDCPLWQNFCDEWKKTGDPKQAFDSALPAAFNEWRDDMEYQMSDESIDGTIEANEYEFDENGVTA